MRCNAPGCIWWRRSLGRKWRSNWPAPAPKPCLDDLGGNACPHRAPRSALRLRTALANRTSRRRKLGAHHDARSHGQRIVRRGDGVVDGSDGSGASRIGSYVHADAVRSGTVPAFPNASPAPRCLSWPAGSRRPTAITSSLIRPTWKDWSRACPALASVIIEADSFHIAATHPDACALVTADFIRTLTARP